MAAGDTTLRRPRTLFILALVTLGVTFVFFYEHIKSSASSLFQEPLILDSPPQPLGDDLYQGIFDDTDSMSYGTAHRPPMKNLPENIIADLPDEFVPAISTHDAGHRKRMVIIGDVHGHKTALQELLKKVNFDSKDDTLIFTGDLINKGPDSAGVVDLAMKLGAHSVRGNHEDRILLTRAAMDSPFSSAHSDSDSNADSASAAVKSLNFKDDGKPVEPISAEAQQEYKEGERALSKGDEGARKVAKSLSHKQVKWLSELPVILRVGPIPRGAEHPAFENLLVVHAGLVPKVALKDQDPWAVMNMRTISYPNKEERLKVVEDFLHQRAKAAVRLSGSNRGSVAAEQAIDGEAVTKELQKILASQGLTDDSERVALPSSGREGKYWYQEWSAWQEKLAKQEKKQEKKEKKGKKGGKKHQDEKQAEPITTVVYGHDAKSGLKVPKELGTGKKGYTFGLDSRCVYGGQLSALVIKVHEDQMVREIVQVDCVQHVVPDEKVPDDKGPEEKVPDE